MHLREASEAFSHNRAIRRISWPAHIRLEAKSIAPQIPCLVDDSNFWAKWYSTVDDFIADDWEVLTRNNANKSKSQVSANMIIDAVYVSVTEAIS